MVFDGWTSGDTHFVGIYASIPDRSQNGYKTILLAFAPLDDETSQDANYHFDYTKWVLEYYQSSFENVTAMTGDNCSTNLSFATKAQAKFVGCASHRFNLAVQDLIEESEAPLQKVNQLMKKLKAPIAAAKLRQVTDLKAKCFNSTRWSSAANMLERYQKIKPLLEDLQVAGIDEFIPTASENRKIDELCEQFRKLNSVTKHLQSESCTISDVRILFDGVISLFPQTEQRLSAKAKIIHQPNFESALSKLQNGAISSLSAAERLEVKRLKRDASSSSQQTNDGPDESFAASLLKRSKRNSTNNDYTDCRYILPTSNLCERLFSKAGYVHSDRRKRILPLHLEQQIFLHVNSDLWSISDLNKLV